MPVINGCYTSAMSLMLLCFFMCCTGFNIDIESAVVYHGPNNTLFGYRAEFLKHANGSTSLLVSAPHFKPDKVNSSGVYFLCDPLQQTCTGQTTVPYTDEKYIKWSTFGEKEEMFGLTVLLVNRSTALVCGPLWSDLIGWGSHYRFSVGRCQLIPPGKSSCSPMTRNVSEYIGSYQIEGRAIKGNLKGLALFGFSASHDGEGHVVIGTPGYMGGKGSFGILTLGGKEFDMKETDLFDDEVDVYLGFAVAAGNFCGKEKICFAVSNKMPSGKVYIVAREQPTVFRKIQLLLGPQNYSSFGFSLCAMDINGDGLSDLLVGAPTYSDHSTDPTSYDCGTVLVYLQLKGTLVKNVNLAGGGKSFARFGSAIGNIGDINQDSIQDVAVGAPQEDEGRGAVYIYLGSSKGPETTFSQRISGRDIGKRLFSFGSHISQPTSDISAYKYPDFIVGSPESNSVVVLRTRLIINARLNIITTASHINISSNLCLTKTKVDSFKPSGCIKLNLCLNYSSSSTSYPYENLLFDLTFQVDSLVAYDPWRRVRLYRGQGHSPVTLLKETVSVNAQQGYCLSLDAILMKEQITRNPFLPVKMEGGFTLNTTTFGGIVKPILNTSLPTSTSAEMQFLTKCGEDQKCRPDLVLSGNVLHVPSEESLDLNVVNITSEVVLNLSLTNKQETAYGIRLTVSIQGQIQFRAADGDGGSHFICESRDNSEKSDDKRSLVTCLNWLHLNQGGALSVKLLFEAASVPLDSSSPVITFNVTSEPYDNVHNPEIDINDNRITLNSQKVIVADLQIIGSSTPRYLYVYDFTHTDLQAAHTLLVTNNGPSFMPATHVNISLPYMDMEGRELVTSHSVMIKQSDGTVEQCRHVSLLKSAVLMTTHSSQATSSSPHTSQKSNVLLPQTTGSPGSQFVFIDVEPSRRRRRQAGNEMQNISENSTEDRDNTLQMDCDSYICQIFQCSLPVLQRHAQAEINVSVFFNSRLLPFSSKIHTMLYLSDSKVAEPSTPFFYRWTEPRSKNVDTLLRHVMSSHREVNIWVIIGGVIGGLAALAIITVILKRLGFFRRADKLKLQRLKRESGYYDNRRRPLLTPPGLTEQTATEGK